MHLNDYGSYEGDRRAGHALKEFRRDLQQHQRDVKVKAETDYFWEMKVENEAYRVNPIVPTEEEAAKREKSLFQFQSQGDVGINFDAFDKIEVTRSGTNQAHIPGLTTFEELSIPDFLLHNINLCYQKPTPIQKHALPLQQAGRDLMCCAQTGSGKTAGFLIHIVSKLATNTDPAWKGEDRSTGTIVPRALILAPTRELVIQIYGETLKFINRSTIKAVQIYGGAQVRPQLLALTYGCDIIVATPGRLIDFLDRKVLTLSAVTLLCLDEADRMLDMGFEPQIRKIVQEHHMPAKGVRQTVFFSATFPPEIQAMAGDFLNNYVLVTIGRVGCTTEDIAQKLVLTGAADKLPVLLTLLEQEEGLTLIFVEKKKTASWLFFQLCRAGINAAAIHGDRTQTERESALNAFKSGSARFLVATDVAARGLDIPHVNHVINYDLPSNLDDYVHRIGRTGRVGRAGTATSLVLPADKYGPAVENNQNIVQPLLFFLKAHNQEIPPWFKQMADAASENKFNQMSHKRGGRGGRGGMRGGRGGYGRGGYQKNYQSQSQYANNDMRLQGHGKQGYLKQAGFQNEPYFIVPSPTMVMGGYQSAVPVYGQAQRLVVPSKQLSTLQFADGGIAEQQYLQEQMSIYGMQGLGQTAVMGVAGSGGYVSRGQQRQQPVYYVANPGQICIDEYGRQVFAFPVASTAGVGMINPQYVQIPQQHHVLVGSHAAQESSSSMKGAGGHLSGAPAQTTPAAVPASHLPHGFVNLPS